MSVSACVAITFMLVNRMQLGREDCSCWKSSVPGFVMVAEDCANIECAGKTLVICSDKRPESWLI